MYAPCYEGIHDCPLQSVVEYGIVYTKKRGGSVEADYNGTALAGAGSAAVHTCLPVYMRWVYRYLYPCGGISGRPVPIKWVDKVFKRGIGGCRCRLGLYGCGRFTAPSASEARAPLSCVYSASGRFLRGDGSDNSV